MPSKRAVAVVLLLLASTISSSTVSAPPSEDDVAGDLDSVTAPDGDESMDESSEPPDSEVDTDLEPNEAVTTVTEESPTMTSTTTTTTTTPTTPRAKPTTSKPPMTSPKVHIISNDQPIAPPTWKSSNFVFTQREYRASIPENSPGKMFVTPEERMGIILVNDDIDIRYKLVGDRDRFFKSEERTLGDFCFLQLRTRAGNTDVLNRERKDKYTLEIRATGTRKERKSKPVIFEANTTVVVHILDVNDLNPLFYPTDYDENVAEDAPLHRSILRVSAEDADQGRNGEVYYSFKEQTDQFAVHPTTGVVTLTRPLQYAETAFHELTVLAQDRGNGRPSSARVRLHVQKVNLFAPDIYVLNLPDIVEQSHSDRYAIVRVTDRDKGVHGEIESVQIVDGDPDGHFRVVSAGSPGEYYVEVLRILDRETAPKGYNLTLRATDKGSPPRQSYRSLAVNLVDINDNAPVFDREIYEVSVPETAPVNTPVIRLKVADADTGRNAEVLLQIVAGNEGGEFMVNPETGMLYTAAPLDAETKRSYTLTVAAIDQGNVGLRRQSAAKVKVNVEDANDNDPLFEHADPVYVNENEPAGLTVARVSAYDKDSGENAYITYSITNLKPTPFEIDHFTGVVRTNQILNYESMRRDYVLRIRANDWGSPFRRQTEMSLRIHIKDVNDNRPQFERVDCVGHVSRHAKIGSELLTLSAIDLDANSIVNYRIESGNEDGCFTLDPSSGVMTVTCDLADVRVSARDINVTASDGEHFADMMRVRVNLLNAKRGTSDEKVSFECRDTGVARRLTEVLAAAERNNMASTNEDFAMMPSRYGENVHAPEFIDFPNEIRINESVAIGSTVSAILAWDRDLGYNGLLVFAISSGDPHSVFKVELYTGKLKVIGFLDRERETEYFLNITVYDLGSPQKSASRLLPVTILDVNDNPPRLQKTLASFHVVEDVANGTVIFRMNATDADTGENARITYSLDTDTDDFAVDPLTGALYVAGPLDRERQDEYQLRLLATDSGDPPLSSAAIVRVTISDINDNAPMFAMHSFSVRALEDIPVGTVVAVLTARDPDLGPGGEIRYSMKETTAGAEPWFRMDPLTGTVRTARALDYEQRQVHQLMVYAQDGGDPSLSSEASLNVLIVDVNENLRAPQFNDLVTNASVLENEPIGTIVTTLRAVDLDPPGEDSRIAYSIGGGDGMGLFSIDDEGVIRTLAVLDAESRQHYWLTVIARDHGVVPLHSSIEVLVVVENVNDNAPLTELAAYSASIPENSSGGKWVAQLQAWDLDQDPLQRLKFRISAGNPENFFALDPDTGVLTTTGRKLDREKQAEHILEVTVSDNGKPALSSTTRVVVNVLDVNDNDPRFDQAFYQVTVPQRSPPSAPLFQNVSTMVTPFADALLENDTWESFDKNAISGEPLLRVLAFDPDDGDNGIVDYSIKAGRGKGKLKIDPQTGIVYAAKSLLAGSEYDISIRAMDRGSPQRSSTTHVSVHVVDVPTSSAHPPVIVNQDQRATVTESDAANFLVAVIHANDEDGDVLWFNIVDGDPRNEFFISRDKGNVHLAKQLDWETQNKYNLTISVTDYVHTVYTQLYVDVLDTNEHRPELSESVYRVDIAESAEIGTSVVQLSATDKDVGQRLFFSLHAASSPASLDLFRVDSLSGVVTLIKPLDRETMEEHWLTVMVKDQGTPSKRNYARVHIRVHDFNDHAPEFSSSHIQGRVFETVSIGSAVLQVMATDRDFGENAKITYSIISGNVGNAFTIDPVLGHLFVARELDMSLNSEYMLIVKAADGGSPPLSSTAPVSIMVSMADDAPPRFLRSELAAELVENLPAGTYVEHAEVRSSSSCTFEIVAGNEGDVFLMNPSTGVVTTKRPLDYETTSFYNLTVRATNMAGVKAECRLIVHVLDRNDNAPRILNTWYEGVLSESAPIGSLVLTNGSTPLVISATDADSELNALLHFDILEPMPRKFFHIDSNTGAISTVSDIDHETDSEFRFHVKVSDRGKPRLSAETMADVVIRITDVNDCPPVFPYAEYNATLVLPTYENVAVIQVNATDEDSAELTKLIYEIDENEQSSAFSMNATTGVLTVVRPPNDNERKLYRMKVRVSDGQFTTSAHINVQTEPSEDSGLTFQKKIYSGAVMENSTKVVPVALVNVLGAALNDHVTFKILNPSDLFEIGKTSGAIRTTGVRFDREEKDNYQLVVEARINSEENERPRIAHVIVNVTVQDVNDNCPMFVNLPYYAVVSVDAVKGDVVTKVHAVDLDEGENGEVRYELVKGHGELFKVARKSGEVSLKQTLEGHNREYELVIAAYDGALRPCSTEVTVHVKVIDKSMPVFDQQFYTVVVPENIQVNSPLDLSISARSTLGRKLIYSIVKGNDFEEFAVDFNTASDGNNGPCVITVVDELDFEETPTYELTLRATDSVSGVGADVLVSILVTDVNDCPPEFSNDSYSVAVSEAAPFGSAILTVTTTDNDTGINAQIVYSIEEDLLNSTDYFHIDPQEGTVYLKRPLDRETKDSHHFTVVATDKGTPSLSTTAHVWISVLDMNDNPPKFEQPSYSCWLSEHASRGQFVTMVTASDPDSVDQEHLTYSIVGGNEQQTFAIHHNTGVIRLVNLQQLSLPIPHSLNVSVTDGVYTSFTRVRIDLQPANKHNPTFARHQYEAAVSENRPAGTRIATVKATDHDLGIYGQLAYSIQSPLLADMFFINKNSGEVTTRVPLDRELRSVYEIAVTATDGGGLVGHTIIRLRVTDENDNPPYFVQREYRTAIHSNFTTNTGFIKVRALDPDDDANAMVEYIIPSKDSSEIKDYFGIKKHSGELYLIKDMTDYENQMFEFFIRAQDRGKPSLHTDVPMEVYIMGPKDVPPIFQRKDDKYFFSENSPPGTMICLMKMATNMSVSYRVVSGDKENPQFAVDEDGRLTIARPLDREAKDAHIIAVVAETKTSPSLAALTEITLKVLDENDNSPRFHSSSYSAIIAENAIEGTSVIKVTAEDLDQGSNGEVRYSLGPESGDAANMFTIDTHTGWISTLVRLDRETTPQYRLSVVANDNGHPRHSSTASVTIRLQDYNDNSPVFTQSMYTDQVNEDALPGTVIVKLATTDADSIVSPVDLYVVSGDPSSQLAIRSTGELYVARPLDRETRPHYNVQIVGTDGKFVATTNVSINVLDANDNPPYCLRHRYRRVISEGVEPGTYVLNILASDLDEESNAKLRYYLTGNGAEYFSLDKSGGHLKTARPLDREAFNKFTLTAHVQDRDVDLNPLNPLESASTRWECSSEIEILVSDLNDNAPSFSLDVYTASLSEDSQIGTLVTKVHATDADIGINRKIKYRLVEGSQPAPFRISSDSGIVTLTKTLDRETTDSYNLTVEASDQGTPQLWTRANLVITVLDVNDNPPEFVSKLYHVTVPENAAVGSTIVELYATSKDIGVNAEISYFIVSGNDHNKFTINKHSGVLTIQEPLDYEVARSYFLSIEAVDGGTPPLSNQATVNITVTDSNDNAPTFSQPVYTTHIAENATVGTKITQVVATDEDSEANGRVSYSLFGGDRLGQFAIDARTGFLTVARPLDRETIQTYVLEIEARDSGVPPLFSTVHVNIHVSDANDNAPIFSESNYTAFVQEGKPLGHPVCQLKVTDADIAPNADPFIFDIQSGNEGSMFRLEVDGMLRTAAKFNHKSKQHFVLRVRVFDSGMPPLYSDTWVTIKVIEESQYPPIISPLEVWINSYQDEFIGGEVAKIHATDQDRFDTLTYSMISPPPQQPAAVQPALFRVHPSTGVLTAAPRLDSGLYRFNVSVTDGKFTANTSIRIFVETITDDMLAESVSITFKAISPEDFLHGHRRGFIKAIRSVVGGKHKDIIIISVQSTIPENVSRKIADSRLRRSTGEETEVLFAVRNSNGSGYVPADIVRQNVTRNIETVESMSELNVQHVSRKRCTNSYCAYGRCEDHVFLERTSTTTVSSDTSSFVSPRHRLEVICHCNQGYSGDRCNTVVNECASEPCSPPMLCVPEESEKGYSCQCPEGLAGPSCSLDQADCHNDVCYSPRIPVALSGTGYARYIITRPLLGKELNVTLWMRTRQPTGCILFAAGPFDYMILEVVKGVVQFRMDLGSGEGLVRVGTVEVNDNRWHEIRLQRADGEARLSVDNTHVAHGATPNGNWFNAPVHQIFLGAEVHPHPSILGYESLRRGFVGCLDAVQLWSTPLPLHESDVNSYAALKRLYNVQFKCKKDLKPSGACGLQPCQNGGTCLETDSGFTCNCFERFTGPTCDVDLTPCALYPCLYGGTCVPETDGDYVCHCDARLRGKRCEYGHFCSPNPCLNGGVCEEGDDGPICKCRVGFTGDACTQDVDECLSFPCLNNGSCVNRAGTYYCICPPNVTGVNCAKLLYPTSITSTIYNITWEELIGIIVAVTTIVFLVLLFVVYRRCRVKRARRRQDNHINNETHKDMVLNCTRMTDSDLKRSSKLSNLEVSQREPLTCNARPASYTPSAHNDQLLATTLNNLDTLRSYGSAGDELENVPPDYLRNLNRHSPISAPLSPSAQLALADVAGKIKNGSKGDDCCRSPGYHWDCSDWVRPSQNPLPNITEVPGSEVPDSSSFHSDESNESHPAHSMNLPPRVESMNPVRDMETLNEEECMDDADDASCYLLHQNYLPTSRLPESDEDDDDVRPYGFPHHGQRTSLLAGAANAGSHSDLSTNLCDIDDSEVEVDSRGTTATGRPWGSVAQTSV